MEIVFTPDVEIKINRIAAQQGRPVVQVVEEIVAGHVDHDEWFRQEVQKGLDSLDRGDFVSHEEVGQRIERILQP